LSFMGDSHITRSFAGQ